MSNATMRDGRGQVRITPLSYSHNAMRKRLRAHGYYLLKVTGVDLYTVNASLSGLLGRSVLGRSPLEKVAAWLRDIESGKTHAPALDAEEIDAGVVPLNVADRDAWDAEMDAKNLTTQEQTT